MKRIVILCAVCISPFLGQEMIVRVYAPSWKALKKISSDYALDIAGARGGEWYDIVTDRGLVDNIVASGLSYEVLVQSLHYKKEQVRGEYLSYDEANDSLRAMAQNYASICKLDSLPIPTYQGRWIYGVKISDNPHSEEDDEPGLLIDGVHHAREWACVPVVIFFADSMLSSYGVVPEITDIINTTEIYCFPIINADGYVFDYVPGGNIWRKNREPFHSYTGTDPNRNYPGCTPDIEADWGAVDEDQASHNPGSAIFCGAYANSGDETRALTMYAKSHICNAYMTYHSYGEVLMWPWGWTGDPSPDAALYGQVGNLMANQIQRLGGGTYGRGSVYSAIYPVSGSSLDWFYSWSHWVGGIASLSFTTELGTEFYQPVNDLDNIVRENFKALQYLASFLDSIVLLTEGVVPPPEIYPLYSVNPDFTVYWHAKNSNENHPEHWELVELSDPSVVEDDLESGTSRWELDGFTLSSSQAHSGTNSLFSGSENNMNHAVRTIHPYQVQSGDSLTFWCSYYLQYDRDIAVVEVSENTKEWFNLDTTRFTGNHSSWERQAYALEDWVGKSIYIRFRSMTNDALTFDGFYVDDISPVCLFSTVDTIASDITDTLYQFTSHSPGEYYYYVRGSNSMWGWGDYSCLEKVNVSVGIAESIDADVVSQNIFFSIQPNPYKEITDIRYGIADNGYKITDMSNSEIKIYDASGRLIKNINLQSAIISHQSSVSWNGTDDLGLLVPAGIYFVHVKIDDYEMVEKVILLR